MAYQKNERIGRMRHQIRYMKPLVGRGDYGQELRTWITSSPVFANIEYLEAGSGEEEIASRKQAVTRALITTRYRSTVYPQMRIKADSQEFAIASVLPDSKRQYMTLEVMVDGPRQQTYVTPEGADWIDEQGQPWVFAFAGDEKTEPATETTYTDSAGVTYDIPDDPGYQDEDGNPLASHEAGDAKTEGSGLDEWTDNQGITWNPA